MACGSNINGTYKVSAALFWLALSDDGAPIYSLCCAGSGGGGASTHHYKVGGEGMPPPLIQLRGRHCLVKVPSTVPMGALRPLQEDRIQSLWQRQEIPDPYHHPSVSLPPPLP